jgi:hypothetical protein
MSSGAEIDISGRNDLRCSLGTFGDLAATASPARI